MKKLFALVVVVLFAFSAMAQTDSTATKLQRYKTMFNKGLITVGEYELLIKPVTGKEVDSLKAEVQLSDVPADSLMFGKGVTDAKDYFRTAGVFGATLGITAVGSPVLGLIPAMVYTFTAPKEKSLGYPDNILWQNTAYRMGYMKEARKERRSSAWKGWGVGVAIDCLAGALTEIVLSTRNKKP